MVSGIPYVDVSSTLDDATRRLFVSVVNRHRTQEALAQVRLRDITPPTDVLVHRLWHADPFARNTIEAPDEVAPTEESVTLPSGTLEITLPPHSYTILELMLDQ